VLRPTARTWKCNIVLYEALMGSRELPMSHGLPWTGRAVGAMAA